MSITVKAQDLAVAWLSVGAASVSDSTRPIFDRTIYVEQYAHGLKLTACDTYMLLTAWVPDNDHELEPEPDDDELPIIEAVACDPYGRGAGLLAHLLRLAKTDKDKVLDLDVIVSLRVPWQSEQDPQETFEGLAALAVTLEHPDNEKVQLGVYDGAWINYRILFAGHKGQKIDGLAISQRMASRIAKAAKVHGEECRIVLRFGGDDKAVAVKFGENTEVRGLVMPIRYDFENDRPAPVKDEEAAE